MPALALNDIDLISDIDVLKGLLTERDSVIANLSAQLESLKQQFLNLRRMHFGATSEKFSGQAELFQEKVGVPVPPEENIRVTYERKRRGRPALPKNLPRERVDYDLSDAEKAEFDSVERIGEEVSETLEYTPPKLIVVEHARAKYACRKDGESTVRTAFAQPSPLPKSNAGAGLLAQILVSTFADHLPLNRQESIFKRHGVDLPRSTLCEWKLGAGELLAVLRPALIAHTLAAPRLHSDDTTMPLIVGGRSNTKTARLWGYLGAGSRQSEDSTWVEYAPAVVFEFTDSRESLHPIAFLKNYRGYLQADAYSGYDAIYKTGRVIEVGCWAHCRRKFFEIAKAPLPPGLATEAIRWIGKLYEIESRIKEHPPDIKLQVRQTEAIPVLADFKRWLDGHYPTLLPQAPLGLAFGYTLRNWQALTRYCESGILAPDNNMIERQIRPIAKGRDAYLFVAAERGGHVAATLYSLIGTCKLNDIEPYAYLKDVLRRLPQHPINRVAELLPFNWQPAAR
jgi:transposase